MLSSSYCGVWFIVGHLRCGFFFLCSRCLIALFDLSSVSYDVVLFVVLLRHFVFLGAIQADIVDLINQIY